MLEKGVQVTLYKQVLKSFVKNMIKFFFFFFFNIMAVTLSKLHVIYLGIMRYIMSTPGRLLHWNCKYVLASGLLTGFAAHVSYLMIYD